MLNEIFWPERFLPGTTDNFASNEVIVEGLTANDVWPYLTHIQTWEKYYGNCEGARYANPERNELELNTDFEFTTFGFDVVGKVIEFCAPQEGIARISWSGLTDGDAEHKLEVVHAWLLEELPGNRLRILTQESQIGKPAKDMAGTTTMIDGHQAWLNGLTQAAKEKIPF